VSETGKTTGESVMQASVDGFNGKRSKEIKIIIAVKFTLFPINALSFN